MHGQQPACKTGSPRRSGTPQQRTGLLVTELIQSLPLNTEQLRSVVLDALRDDPNSNLSKVCGTVARLAVERKLVPNPLEGRGMYGGSFGLNNRDWDKVHEILWDLVIEGIIRPGYLNSRSHEQWPFFHTTEYGKTVVELNRPTPFDPDGYLRRLSNDIPNLDPVIVDHLTECLKTFRVNCLLSSTVMLGAACEKAFLLLVEAYAQAIVDPARKQRFESDTKAKMIKRQWDEFEKQRVGRLMGLLPGDIKEDLETALNGVFSMVRNYRNDAGHPTGRRIDREVLYAAIVVVPIYLKKVYDLIGWLRANPIN